jgi:monoamine oxidase
LPLSCKAVTALGSLANRAAKIRRDSFRLLHFIGTETSVDYQGYIERALSSGDRVAAEAIALLSI